jgi:hypothetical protein
MNRGWGRVFIIACACILGSCSGNGLRRRRKRQPVITDVYRIQAGGNAYTGLATVQDFYLLKAAETTIGAGGSHFLIMGAENQTSVSTEQTPGYASTSVVGRSAFTTYTPGATYNVIKPGQGFIPIGPPVPASQPTLRSRLDLLHYIEHLLRLDHRVAWHLLLHDSNNSFQSLGPIVRRLQLGLPGTTEPVL